jgi:hypothetical protein
VASVNKPSSKDNLKAAYRRFLKKQEPEEKEQAGKDLIRAIFGKAGIAKGSSSAAH